MVKCVGKALLLPKDMSHWEQWEDDALLLNMKREAIMVTYLPFYILFFILKLLLFLTPSLQGYQCSAVVEIRYLATKTKLEELVSKLVAPLGLLPP